MKEFKKITLVAMVAMALVFCFSCSVDDPIEDSITTEVLERKGLELQICQPLPDGKYVWDLNLNLMYLWGDDNLHIRLQDSVEIFRGTCIQSGCTLTYYYEDGTLAFTNTIQGYIVSPDGSIDGVFIDGMAFYYV